MTKDLLFALGIEVKLLFASFCGGIVSVFFAKTTTAFTALGLVVTGTFTGHWFGGYAAKVMGLSDPAGGFLIGFLAMSVLQYVTELAKKKMASGGVTNEP